MSKSKCRKPHISLKTYARRSYWKVSLMPDKWNRCSKQERSAWAKAHEFVVRINEDWI